MPIENARAARAPRMKIRTPVLTLGRNVPFESRMRILLESLETLPL